MDVIAKRMSEIQWEYGDKDPQALASIESRIAETGRNLKLIHYSDLAKGIAFHLPNFRDGKAYYVTTWEWTGLDRRIIGDFLGYSSYRSYIQHGFMASALVAGQDSFMPSDIFFKWMKDLNVLPDLEEDTVLRFWADQVNEAHNWYNRGRRR